MTPPTVTVIGAGSWGTTLAHLLGQKGIPVRLWVRRPELAAHLARRRENPDHLPGVPLAAGVVPGTSFPDAVAGCRFLVCALPSHTVRDLFLPHRALIPADAVVISATKGIEEDSMLTMTQTLGQVLDHVPREQITVLSGPSFAREVALGKPAAVVAAAPLASAAERVQELFTTSAFRVYTNKDTLGVELGAAYKNVIAIAAGACDGLGLGNNTRAALITRGLAEISRLGAAMGALPETFSGLAGLGDLVLTCTGDLSRNRFVGLELGKGRPLPEILAGMRAVAEGVRTTRAVVSLGQRYKVDLPIAREVYGALYGGKDPRRSVLDLMTRDRKAETG